MMDAGRSGSPDGAGEAGTPEEVEEDPFAMTVEPDFGAPLAVEAEGARRDRSPTPPKALFRSTTGKGVAFTVEDTQFLVKFYEHRQ